MKTKVRPFLMFEGRAEEAINFYVSLVPGSEIVDIQRYGKGQPGPEGSVFKARFTIAGQQVMAIDSPVKHAFGFTPSWSFFVECDSEEELRRLAAALGQDGKIYMGIDNHGFSRLFTWVGDRFGVSWQLNLE